MTPSIVFNVLICSYCHLIFFILLLLCYTMMISSRRAKNASKNKISLHEQFCLEEDNSLTREFIRVYRKIWAAYKVQRTGSPTCTEQVEQSNIKFLRLHLPVIAFIVFRLSYTQVWNIVLHSTQLFDLVVFGKWRFLLLLEKESS